MVGPIFFTAILGVIGALASTKLGDILDIARVKGFYQGMLAMLKRSESTKWLIAALLLAALASCFLTTVHYVPIEKGPQVVEINPVSGRGFPRKVRAGWPTLFFVDFNPQARQVIAPGYLPLPVALYPWQKSVVDGTDLKFKPYVIIVPEWEVTGEALLTSIPSSKELRSNPGSAWQLKLKVGDDLHYESQGTEYFGQVVWIGGEAESPPGFSPPRPTPLVPASLLNARQGSKLMIELKRPGNAPPLRWRGYSMPTPTQADQAIKIIRSKRSNAE
jgi:hypothetical protein